VAIDKHVPIGFSELAIFPPLFKHRAVFGFIEFHGFSEESSTKSHEEGMKVSDLVHVFSCGFVDSN
jgi:hypothetical protein